MLAAVLLAAGLVLGISPVIIAIAAVAAIEPRLVLVGAAIWGIVAALRRRVTRVTPDDEATLFRAMAAELRSGASLRSALSEAAPRAPRIQLDRPVRFAAAGMQMTEIAEAIEAEMPENGRLAAAAFRLSDWSGARVADTFDGLAERAAATAELARERRAATAQARLSAVIVGVAPLAFTVLLVATGRGSGLVAYGGLGWLILGVGLGLEMLGLIIVATVVRRAER
ncbi:MAG: type II secretion system F family protein [Actinomycetota bacterium]|nr:type II secretion system F family protein [Actinomycetota bacterium]